MVLVYVIVECLDLSACNSTYLYLLMLVRFFKPILWETYYYINFDFFPTRMLHRKWISIEFSRFSFDIRQSMIFFTSFCKDYIWMYVFHKSRMHCNVQTVKFDMYLIHQENMPSKANPTFRPATWIEWHGFYGFFFSWRRLYILNIKRSPTVTHKYFNCVLSASDKWSAK